jgi:hypothetical protein
MKKLCYSFLLCSLLSFSSSGQLFNGDFEIWDTTSAACYHNELTDTFAVANVLGGTLNRWEGGWCGMCQTTDAFSGNYALVLYNWYVHAYGDIRFSDSISHRPLFLQGHYKYILGGIPHQAQGLAKISLTHYNGLDKDTIATGTFLFDSTDSYKPFQISLNYLSALNPDSINIYFINADGNSGFGGLVSNLLFLDNLTLSNSPLGIETANSTGNIVSVFPNPVVNELHIQNKTSKVFRFILFNSIGKKILDQELNGPESIIDLSDYSNDIYFYNVITGDNKTTSGKIIRNY